MRTLDQFTVFGSGLGQRRAASASARSGAQWLTFAVDLTSEKGQTDAYVCRLLPLTCLAPDIVEVILDGRQPKGLRLVEMLGNGPTGWDEQRNAWSFSQRTTRCLRHRKARGELDEWVSETATARAGLPASEDIAWLVAFWLP